MKFSRKKEKTVELVAQEQYEGEAIVCFLDLLGFSATIKSEWGKSNNNLLKQVMSLKNEIKNISITSNSKFVSLFNSRPDTKVSFNVKFISDSIIITFPTDKINDSNRWMVISALINTIMKFWGESIRFGFTIRGGIEVGNVFWNENDIIGPAYVKAVELENKADYSRVICGNDFVRFIKDDEMSSSDKFQRFYYDGKYLSLNPSIINIGSATTGKVEIIGQLKNLQAQASGKVKQYPARTVCPAEKYTKLIEILENDQLVCSPTEFDIEALLR